MFQTQISVYSSFYSRKLLGSGFPIDSDMHQKRWFCSFSSVHSCHKWGQCYKRWPTNLLLGYIKEEKNPQARTRRRQPFNAFFSPKGGQMKQAHWWGEKWTTVPTRGCSVFEEGPCLECWPLTCFYVNSHFSLLCLGGWTVDWFIHCHNCV